MATIGRDGNEVLTPQARMYLPSVPFDDNQPATLHCAIRGFEIPSFPGLDAEARDQRKDLIKAILYRFQAYLTELHTLDRRRALALQFMSREDESRMGSRVRAYMLCRSADADREKAADDAVIFAREVTGAFPSDGIYTYGTPRAMGAGELERALFLAGGKPMPNVSIAEIRKFEERHDWAESPLGYVPHRFWADEQRDPWLSLIEMLGSLRINAAIRVELTPAALPPAGAEFIASAGRLFNLVNADLKRLASQGDKVEKDVVTTDMLRKDLTMAFAVDAVRHLYAWRGDHVFGRINIFADSLFCVRVVLASLGEMPTSLIGGVRAALSRPSPENPEASNGWRRPEVLTPRPGESTMAFANLNYLAQTRWGPASRDVPDMDMRCLVTPEEAVALFHLPVYDRAGLTSAVSTVDSPFVIPPETLNVNRDMEDGEELPRIVLGHLYQRDRRLDPENSPEGAQPFHITIDDLMKPSLLVGAPGSGKTNLAMTLLMDLWDRNIPFLVLDPSTGQEFRQLLRHPKLNEDLVVYTVGDEGGVPLRFNPFSLPPGVTVRAHTTRLLAAFRAAIEMADPVPAVFEGALERLYTDSTYSNPPFTMSDKGDIRGDQHAPTFNDLNKAMLAELNERVLPLYAGSAETTGNMRGASTMRVNAIARKLGFILNAKGNNGAFLEEMLRRPTVIEMGALGDSSSIALVMGFFLTQLIGQIEHAHAEDKDRRHLIFIEEAHRLLGAHGGEGRADKAAEDLNTMLAEVRKFGQGILVMDQRPSSLVGGVLDNALIKIMMRLSDREGFERLSDELNLNAAQQRFARTRLKGGDAIVLDRDAGQPVLLRGRNAKTMFMLKLSAKEMLATSKANAASVLTQAQPAGQAYVELAPSAPSSMADKRKRVEDGAAADKLLYWWIAKMRHDRRDEAKTRDFLRDQLRERHPAFTELEATEQQTVLRSVLEDFATRKMTAEQAATLPRIALPARKNVLESADAER